MPRVPDAFQKRDLACEVTGMRGKVHEIFFIKCKMCSQRKAEDYKEKKKKDDSAQWYLRTWVKFSWINSLKKLVGGRYMYITELFPLPGILREKRLIKEKK